MPQTKSQIKNLKTTLRNRVSNKKYKQGVKQAIKQYLLSIKIASDNKSQDNIDLCNNNLSIVYKKIDKAVKKSILHKNTASRKKSTLSKLLKQISI
uniref:Small ribosomal subunit protein bS20c n=1 Tax=Kapraunia schneideri TaxID=717899 RepID=A0A1Z1MS35_9FLOR|nr:ribosomal protein S20 [Kapraunia schneideri]ARW68913.1 ribosomal protein S20 [Kapraunia schneideri]